MRWIDLQIGTLEQSSGTGDDPSSTDDALELLRTARTLVYDTGEVPQDMVQQLCFDLKCLAGKARRRISPITGVQDENGHTQTDTLQEQCIHPQVSSSQSFESIDHENDAP